MIKPVIWETNPPAIIQPFETTRQAVHTVASTDAMSEDEFVEDFFKRSIAFLQNAQKNIHRKYPKMFE